MEALCKLLGTVAKIIGALTALVVLSVLIILLACLI